MATLSSDQLTELRQTSCRAADAGGITLNATKTTINTALQAIEDYFENTVRAGFGSAIGGGFTNAQKKILVAYYLRQKFVREGV